MDGDPQTDSSNELIDLRGDGSVVLYKRPGLKKPKWQVRVRVPKATGYRIVSSKTSNWDEAKRFADELYEQTYIRRSLRQCIWMSAATVILLLYLLVFD